MSIKFHQNIDNQIKQLLDSDHRIPACKQGCTVCCEKVNLFGAYEEIPTIVRALNNLDFKKRKLIAKQIKTIDANWQGSGSIFTSDTLTEEQRKQMNSVINDNSYSCPLLIDGRCVIYKNRPVVCRTYFSSSSNLCHSWNADMNFAKNIDVKGQYMDKHTGIPITPMPLFRNIDFIDNKFIFLSKNDNFVKVDQTVSATENISKKQRTNLQSNSLWGFLKTIFKS